MQLQRRLSAGLQFGVAYTFSKAEGVQGWDPYTQDIRERYYGPTATDRRHLFSVNYSYIIPGPADTNSLMGHLLGDWQISGITKFQTGAPATPGCTSNNAGIANSDPSLSGLGTNAITGVRCVMISDPYQGVTPDDDLTTARLFNTTAFVMAQPVSADCRQFWQHADRHFAPAVVEQLGHDACETDSRRTRQHPSPVPGVQRLQPGRVHLYRHDL